MRSLAPLVIVAVASCSPSRAGVFRPVQSDVERRLGVRPVLRSGTDARVPAAVAELLTRPLDRDAVVKIAIANSHRLQVEYDELGIAASRVTDATVLAPTEVDIEYKFGSGDEVELDVIQDVLGLIQMPQRRGVAGAQVRAARARATAATVALAARAEAAFYDVVAAQQELELRQTSFDAASAAAELAERMYAAGNMTDLDLAREQAFREQTRIDLARAQADLEVRREELNSVLGLHGGDTGWSVIGRLPDLPAEAPGMDDIEVETIESSLELAALRADAESAAGQVAGARLRTILPELGVGAAATRREDGEWEAGPAVRIGLPLFNWQQGPRQRAHAELRRARNHLTAQAIESRAAARAARQRVLAAHAEARHLIEVVLPLRQRVLDETLLQYNAMNASTFELLSARREQVDAGRQYIDALRRYWAATSAIEALRRGGVAAATATTQESATGGDTGNREQH